MPQKIVLNSFAELAGALDVLGLEIPAADAAGAPVAAGDADGVGAPGVIAYAPDAFGATQEGEAGTEVSLTPGAPGVPGLPGVPTHPATAAISEGSGDAVSGDPALHGLAGLLAELERASATLATVARQDQETRALALRDLERYDAVLAEQRQAEEARARARQVREEAERLAAAAFADEARAAAGRVAAVAARTEAAAATLADERQGAAERLVRGLALERLLAERRREEEAEHARAAAAERARRLSEALAGASSALEAGRLEEARALLGPVCQDHPDDACIASLLRRLAQREAAVKALAADEALWEARRAFKKDPEAALTRLEALDMTELPEPLTRQVFGAWARACARLCRRRELAEPLRYAPDPGRGAVLAREAPEGPVVVVRALGLGPEWRAGAVVPAGRLRLARPLRLDE